MVEAIKHAINVLSRPQYYFTIVTILLFVSTLTPWAKNFWTKKSGIIGLAFIALFMGFSLRNPNFRAIITFPDNVPIIGMLMLVFGGVALLLASVVTCDTITVMLAAA